MSYLEKTLSEGEEIKVRAHLHWINYAGTVIFTFCALFTLLCYYVGEEATDRFFLYLTEFFIVTMIVSILRILTTELVITNKRVVFKYGIISVQTDELLISKIESVELDQSVIGRVFNFGNINFSGTGSAKVNFPIIANPREIKSQMEDVIHS